MTLMEEQKGAGKLLKPQHIVLLLLAVVIVAAAAVVICLQYDPVVAVVNGEKIKRSELYEAMYTQGGRETLEDIIIRQLILQEGKKSGISVSEEEIDAEIDSIIEEHFMGMKDQFDSFLEQRGLTMAMIRKDARVNLMAERIVTKDLEIDEKEVQEYFTENRDLFDIPEEVKARHILVETEEEALEVIALLEKGEDFAEVAKEHSTDPGSKDKGGELGFFTHGDMVKEFEEAAFALEVGERSKPVKTFHGFHVIEKLDYKEGREVAYEEVKDEVKETIIEEKIPALIQALITRLKEEAAIDYRD